MIRALKNSTNTKVVQEIRGRPSPPAKLSDPPKHPKTCARCIKAGPKVRCVRPHPYADCYYCRKHGNKCLPVRRRPYTRVLANFAQLPKELWPSARKIRKLYKDARRSSSPGLWRRAEETGKSFEKDINFTNARLRKTFPGGPLQREVAKLGESSRRTNQSYSTTYVN